MWSIVSTLQRAVGKACQALYSGYYSVQICFNVLFFVKASMKFKRHSIANFGSEFQASIKSEKAFYSKLLVVCF